MQYSVADTQKENECEELILEKLKLEPPESKPSFDKAKRLNIGDEKSFVVFASRRMNYSGIYLEEGTYTFMFSQLNDWCDASVKACVNGWPDQESFFLTLLSWTHWVSRFPTGKLYTVIGGIHNQRWTRFNMGTMQNDEKFSVNQDQEGELYAFANDIYFKYDNNYGRVTITVKRES